MDDLVTDSIRPQFAYLGYSMDVKKETIVNMRVAAITGLLLVASLPALAKPSGNDVLDKCQTAIRFFDNDGAPVREHYDSGWCYGWISGTLEITRMHNDWANFTKQKPNVLQFCLPDPGVPVIQAAKVVVKYLKEHPDQLHEDGMGLTLAALKNNFPCK